MAGEAHEQDRALGRPEYVLDEVEHRRLRPVHVFEDNDERSGRRHGLEQLAHAPEGLFDGELLPGKADGRGDASSHCVVMRQVRDLRPCHVGRILLEDSRGLSHDLDDWPEGDASAVREAAPAHDRGRAPDLRDELLDQARLPHPWASEHGREPAAIARHRLGEGREELPHLSLSADERPLGAASAAESASLRPSTL